MQTREAIKGLHNSREFTQLTECLNGAVVKTRKKSSIALIKISISQNVRANLITRHNCDYILSNNNT